MNEVMPVVGFLLVLFGVPLAIYILFVLLASAAAKPVVRAQQQKRIEREVRSEVDYANARQKAARKILNEYDK